MNSHGSVIFAFGTVLATVSCSGSYQVGFDPVAGAPASAGTSSNSASSGGATSSGSNTSSNDGGVVGDPEPVGGTGSSGGGGIVDPTAKSRCGFATEPVPALADAASQAVVLGRIYQFLDNAPGTMRTLPDAATAEWAAEQATAILDQHLLEKTEPAGLVRFLTSWLKLSSTQATAPAAAHTWALKLLDPTATLSTLLAEPTGDAHRLGILTDPEVLAARTTISTRGAWMNAKLFCQVVPPSPPSTPNVDPASPTGVTYREKLASLVSPAVCNSCHTIMDPPGYALEHFDAQGDYREKDAGEAVDSSGALTTPLSASFQSFDELAPELATSCPVAKCFSQEVAGDAFTANELPALGTAESNQLADAFANDDFSIRALVEAVVTSPSFLK